MRRTVLGFTLIEVLVVVVVAGIGLALGVPSFKNSIKNSRLTSGVNELLSSIHLARSEASTRGADVEICRSSDPYAVNPVCGGAGDWSDGWLVITPPGGTTIIKRGKPMHSRLNIQNTTSLQDSIIFRRNGFASNIVGQSQHFVLCDEASESDHYSRVLTISNSGRPQVVARVNIGSLFVVQPCPENEP